MAKRSPKPKGKFSFKAQNLDVQCLLLDPNNYRFIDNPTFKKRIKTKYHLDSVQEATLRLLEQGKAYQLAELKKSIRTNGYVPMERVIVVRYRYKPNTFLVVEGNRRVAALKSLMKEHTDGVIHLDHFEVKSFSKIPCAILLAEDETLQHVERVIMGIRHIAGPKEWGAYQQAQLITEFHDQEGYDFQRVGDHLGISPVEAARRYRAMRALHYMEEDELYADKAEPKFYRLFHELVSLPNVRERFGWDSKTDTFSDMTKAREFFELIAPQTDGDIVPKLGTYFDVRKLRPVIGNALAEASLTDPEQPLSEALKVAEMDKDYSPTLMALLTDINKSLSKIGISEIKLVTEAQIALIDKIISALEDIKTYHQNIT